MKIQGWFPFGLTGMISLLSKGLSRLFSSKTESINSSVLSLLYGPILTFIHEYWKNHSFDHFAPLSAKWSLLFNMLCRFVIVVLPSTKHLLISWLQSLSSVILEPQEIKSVTVFIFFLHLFAMKWWDQMPWSFLYVEAPILLDRKCLSLSEPLKQLIRPCFYWGQNVWMPPILHPPR